MTSKEDNDVVLMLPPKSSLSRTPSNASLAASSNIEWETSSEGSNSSSSFGSVKGDSELLDMASVERTLAELRATRANLASTSDNMQKAMDSVHEFHKRYEDFESKFDVMMAKGAQRLRMLSFEPSQLQREDPDDEIERKTNELADLIKSAKSVCVVTGAELSASAGVPEFYSTMEQGLTPKDGKMPKISGQASIKKGDNEIFVMQPVKINRHSSQHKARLHKIRKARPTISHKVLTQMYEAGKLKHIVSQNIDGLHLKSGIPQDAIRELHGNVFTERCPKCHKTYERDYTTRSASLKGHSTRRDCDDPDCKGKLKDTIVSFGEKLPARAIKGAQKAVAEADLTIVFGSSLCVEPAGTLAMETSVTGGRVVIVNQRETPYEEDIVLRIYSPCDRVLQRLGELLGYPPVEADKKEKTAKKSAK